MRFSKEDKIKMYRLYQKGYGYEKIKEYYPINSAYFYYLMSVLERYGTAWLNRPCHKWTSQEKKKAIDRVLINHESLGNIALDLGLSSSGAVANWIRIYQKNDYNIIDKPLGSPKKTITKHNKQKELERKLLYLRAENAYLKALRELTNEKQKK